LARLIVLLSGPVSSRKTTLCMRLVARFGFAALKTRDVIAALSGARELTRQGMQGFGEKLDRQTGGAWVCNALTRMVNGLTEDAIVVIDAVRTIEQVEKIRNAYGPRVVHIHLWAPLEVLARRYAKKREKDREFKTYDQVMRNMTERNIGRLAEIADISIDTNKCTDDDVVIRAASHLGLYGREYLRLVDVLVGGQYGSEGKGHIASYLAREYDVLVRVGGPNAGHTVFESPKPYVFHQLPSGTRASNAKIIIGPGAVLNVGTLLREIADCHVDEKRLSIDPNAMIISKGDIRGEQRLKDSIGSTGQGVGSATARRIRDRGKESVKLAKHTSVLTPFVRDTSEILDRAFFDRRKVLLEGTQGTGLSLYHGPYPFVTSRETTVAGCLAEAGISPSRVRRVILVCRSYPIRVQSPSGSTSGPLSQEITWRDISRRSGIPHKELQQTERTSTTRRSRRVGEFDWQLLRKSASLNAPTDLALTFTDYLSAENTKARRFEQLTDETIRFIEEVERVVAAPVSLIATRFHSRSIIDRRAW